MGAKKSTGVIFHNNGNGQVNALDLSQLKAYAKDIPEVEAVWQSSEFTLTDIDLDTQKISAKNLDRLIIAGDMPGLVKSFFSRVFSKSGKAAENVVLASFKEINATTADSLDRAKALLFCAVKEIPFDEAAVAKKSAVNENTLVIGGGIAGIQASLEIANANKKVFLVEKSGTIGGHMAMFDKTFPTLDCAACILTPKMVEVGQHPFIEMLTYSEVTGVSGSPGNYKVKILKKARRVNLSTCIGCGTCSEKCPATAPSEFDAGTTLRKAIYIPFPQAVPNKYLIDPDSCIYVDRGKCGVCVKVCPVTDCINLDEKDEEVELTVGNIIVATGFQVFDAKRAEQFGYGKFPNVITSLEFERLVNAAGPTGGGLHFRTTDKKGNMIFTAETDTPKSVALIHCIGSRDENYNKYCSKVCCMYSLKMAHLVKEKLPDAEVTEYYIDMRAFGKGYEEFYNRISEEGINIIRGRTAKIEEGDSGLLLRTEDMENGKLIEKQFDMAILAVGLEPNADAEKLAKILNISRSGDGWFVESNYISDPVNTFTGGIHIAGLCQGPKDIPDTVAQASAAASRVLQSISNGQIEGSINAVPLNAIEERVRELSTMEERS